MTTSLDRPTDKPRTRSAVGAALVMLGLALVGYAVTPGPLKAQTAPANPSSFTATVPGQVILRLIKVPEPANLGDFVLDKSVAIQLGKAFFWDEQAGSDGSQACASCHFAAGADVRTRNQVNPGKDGVFQMGRPNTTLSVADFPLHKLADPANASSTVLSDADDVIGSQGVLDRTFGSGPAPADPSVDRCTLVADPVFNVGGLDVRRVTGRNAPSVINAVFNFRNFWDGRANDTFNGVSPFGPRDTNAHVWKLLDGQLQPAKIALPFSSLASQATGPGLSPVEMSCDGRVWPNVGRKLLGLSPLAKQFVDPTDSVLGSLAASRQAPSATGLGTSYRELIKQAFRPEWWSGTAPVTVGNGSFSQMEANFSLFWGLAIQTYEATLVSDDTPLDRFASGDGLALSPRQQRGMDVFMNKGRCASCHSGAEFSGASVSNVVADRYERMHMGNNGIAVYDNGYYNTGVRPTPEDVGVGGTDPFGNPLSEVGFCEQALQQGVACTIVNQNQNGPVANASVANLVNGRAGEGIGPAPLRPACPAGTPSSTATCDRINVLGAFKTPGLRNVELTGPYMHNGGMATLQQVVEFYDRGGDFAQQNIDNLDPNILPLHLTAEQRDDLVQFLVALTDERVRWQRAPFDHPELCFPNGDFGDQSAVAPDPVFTGAGRDQVLCLAAAGASGAAIPLQPFLTAGPFEAPTPTPTTPVASAPPPAISAPAPAISAPAPLPTSTPVAVAAEPTPTSAPTASRRAASGSASPRVKVPASPAPVVSEVEPLTPQASQTIDLIPPAASQPASPPPPPLPTPTPLATPLATPSATLAPAVASDDESAVSVAPAAPAPSMVSASIDPAVGGVLMTIDGAVSVTVPAGAAADTLVVSLGADQGLGNLRLGGKFYLLNAQDSVGSNVTSFDQPLIVTLRRSEAAAAPGDRRARLSAVLDADFGAFQSMPTTVNPDGSLTMTVDRLAPLPVAQAAPVDASASAEAPLEIPILSDPTADDDSLAAAEAPRTGDQP